MKGTFAAGATRLERGLFSGQRKSLPHRLHVAQQDFLRFVLPNPRNISFREWDWMVFCEMLA